MDIYIYIYINVPKIRYKAAAEDISPEVVPCLTRVCVISSHLDVLEHVRMVADLLQLHDCIH